MSFRVSHFFLLFFASFFATAVARGEEVDTSAIVKALRAPRERCFRSEWVVSLERQFEQENREVPFWAAHLANGFLCQSGADLRQFLLLSGGREFPKIFSQVMTVVRAKLLAQEDRALREAQSGVRILIPQNPQACGIDVEGLEYGSSFEMRSLPGRYLHVRYRCGEVVERHVIFVHPGAVSVSLPPAPALQPKVVFEKSDEKESIAHDFRWQKTSCAIGAALVFGGRSLGFAGVNDTEIPILAHGACALGGWRLSALLGEVEALSRVGNLLFAEKVLFFGGSFDRELMRWAHGSFQYDVGVGTGFWAAAEVVNPVHVRGSASVLMAGLRVVVETGVAISVQNPSQGLFWLGLRTGMAR
jgi:hypothetical protein